MAPKKQKKPKAPPLSAVDKAIYNIMIWGCLVGPWMFVMAAAAIVRSGVLASAASAVSMCSLWLAYCCAGMFLAALFEWMKRKRYPVFGDGKVKYGPPRYNEVYPLLGKRETSRRPDKRWKKTAAALKNLWLLAFAVLLSGLLFLAPDYVLTENDSVEVYDRLGRIKEVYAAEQIAELELDGVVYGGRGGTKTLILRLKMEDGEEFSFSYGDFDHTKNPETSENRAISVMQHIKSRIDPAAVTIKNVHNLPKFAERYHLSATEEAQLYALFEVELP